MTMSWMMLLVGWALEGFSFGAPLSFLRITANANRRIQHLELDAKSLVQAMQMVDPLPMGAIHTAKATLLKHVRNTLLSTPVGGRERDAVLDSEGR